MYIHICTYIHICIYEYNIESFETLGGGCYEKATSIHTYIYIFMYIYG
jgi:hypothetical protein